MAGLPWIKVAADLRENEKSVRLAAMLGDRRAWSWVVGLWMWCAEQQGDGRVEGPLEEAKGMIEFGASWDGPAGQLADALIRCGFVEESDGGSLLVHDWVEWQAAHADRTAKERERKAKYREKQRAAALASSDCPTGQDAGRPAGHAGQIGKRVESRDQRPTTPSLPLGADAPAAGGEERDPRKAEKRAAWERVFFEAKKARYYWQGAKDAQAINRLIAVPVDEWEARARRGLSSREYATRISTVAQLGMKWNDLAGPAAAPATQRVITGNASWKDAAPEDLDMEKLCR